MPVGPGQRGEGRAEWGRGWDLAKEKGPGSGAHWVRDGVPDAGPEGSAEVRPGLTFEYVRGVTRLNNLFVSARSATPADRLSTASRAAPGYYLPSVTEPRTEA